MRIETWPVLVPPGVEAQIHIELRPLASRALRAFFVSHKCAPAFHVLDAHANGARVLAASSPGMPAAVFTEAQGGLPLGKAPEVRPLTLFVANVKNVSDRPEVFEGWITLED